MRKSSILKLSNLVWFFRVKVSTVRACVVPAWFLITAATVSMFSLDLVINRTLVYGPLTAMLVLVYVGGVVSFQNAFRALTGQESQIAVVASTLAIAALFNPLRGRLQTFVNRRFYRTKYDAAKTLASFSARLRDETNLDALNTELVKVVQETMQPAHASLWLRPDPATQSPPSVSTRFEKGDEG